MRFVLMLSLFALALPVFSRAQESENQVPDCLHVSKEAPYQGYGYTHIVVLENTCARAARCQVATDVDPTRIAKRVAAGATERVATRRGSPASAFSPRVSCTLEGG
ncbi:MAG: hypothetical protein R3B99_29495 [Polyangiales bacterium]|nr:hypothetical protein [Sandaracinus sp.]